MPVVPSVTALASIMDRAHTSRRDRMFTKFRLTSILAAGALALGLSSVAEGQVTTDVTLLDGAGNTIASDVRSFDENEAGSGLAAGFTPVVGSTFTFLYQSNVVGFNSAAG